MYSLHLTSVPKVASLERITLLVKSVYYYVEAFEFWINQCVEYLITASRIIDNFLLRKGKASQKN